MPHKVMMLADLPAGAARLVKVAGRSVGLYNVGGEVSAVDDICPHRGAVLSQGEFTNDVVTCPLHGWRFNVKTGASCDIPGVKVAVLSVKVENGEIWIE